MSWANMFNGGGGGAGILEAAKTAAMEAALWALTGYTDLGDGFYDTFLYDTDIPVMKAETTDGTTITTRSALSTNYGWKVGDRVHASSSSWVASAAPSPTDVQWLRVSRAEASTISRYTVYTRTDTTYVYEPKSLKAFVSMAENPSNYTTIAEYEADDDWTEFHELVNNTVGTSDTKIIDYTLPAPLPWKHLTLVCTARNGAAARVGIGKIYVYPGDGVSKSTVTNATIASGKITPTTSGGTSSGDITPTMTSANTPSGEVWHSSADTSNGYPGWKAFDKDATGYDAWFTYHSYEPAGQYPRLAYKFDEVKTISGITLQAAANYLACCPQEFNVYGSNDATSATAGTWTLIKSFTTGTWSKNTEVRTFNFDSPVKYSRIRIEVTNSGTTYTAIGEMGILGVATPATVNEATIVSTADTASSAPTYAMGMVWLDADGSEVTDATESNNAIRLYFSRDGGTSWQWLPLEEIGTLSGDVKLYACNKAALTTTSGTSVKLKVTSHDLGDGAPAFELHGWGTVYKVGS